MLGDAIVRNVPGHVGASGRSGACAGKRAGSAGGSSRSTLEREGSIVVHLTILRDLQRVVCKSYRSVVRVNEPRSHTTALTASVNQAARWGPDVLTIGSRVGESRNSL